MTALVRWVTVPQIFVRELVSVQVNKHFCTVIRAMSLIYNNTEICSLMMMMMTIILEETEIYFCLFWRCVCFIIVKCIYGDDTK